jgi:hypothetical protein
MSVSKVTASFAIAVAFIVTIVLPFLILAAAIKKKRGKARELRLAEAQRGRDNAEQQPGERGSGGFAYCEVRR